MQRRLLFMEPFGGSAGRRLDCRQGTEAVGFNGKHRIEFTAEIFQSDNRRKLYQLLLGEVALQTLEKAVGDPFVRVSHTLGQLKRQALAHREKRTFAVIPQGSFHFFRRRAVSHPTGCVDVDSIRTAVDTGGFHTEEMPEFTADHA